MGAICPKGKISKSRKGMRRAQSWRIATPELNSCPSCGELIVPHRVCRSCGAYNKRTVINMDK